MQVPLIGQKQEVPVQMMMGPDRQGQPSLTLKQGAIEMSVVITAEMARAIVPALKELLRQYDDQMIDQVIKDAKTAIPIR